VSAARRTLVVAVFTLTGFSALALQVTWQRVLSLHSGVDLASVTTVVAAFLAGLGFGNLLGGVLADRLDARRALFAYGLANAAIGVFAWTSLYLFDDLYRSLASDLRSTLATFGFNALLLIVPTTLMGLSLPLVSRGIVETVEDVGPLVGRLYAWNTLGAAAGAAVTGWLVLGTFGFTTTVRLAGSLNVLAAVVAIGWGARAPAGPRAAQPPAVRAEPSPPTAEPAGATRVWPWSVLYGATGAVALGLEIVFFRIVDAVMRGNAYTFGHLLTLYLLLFGIGGAVGSRLVRRARRLDQWFLALQGLAGVSALAGVLVLMEAPALVGVDDEVTTFFRGGGFTLGYPLESGSDLARLVFGLVVAPLVVMGLPALALGASFPFVQAHVTPRLDVLGRRTGGLLFANIVGNVTGTLLVGFVLVNTLGTAGTLVLLGAALGTLLTVAAARRRPGWWPAVVAGAGTVALAVAAPSNHGLWAYLHGAEDVPFAVEEDRSCVTAMKLPGDLYINANQQNGFPFDDFHVLIGLTPALLHPAPARAISVGLGIGATPYGMLLDPRVGRVDTVELCGRLDDLLGDRADEGAVELQRLFADPRLRLDTGDGRSALVDDRQRYDIITVDALRPQSAASGSLYSVEFFELARDRLADGGLLAGWASTSRTVNSVTEVFEHVQLASVPSYFGLVYYLASNDPITLDPAELSRRLSAAPLEAGLPAEQAAGIRAYFAAFAPQCQRAGGSAAPVDDGDLNRDLFPRDEYFLNQPDQVPVRAAC
jgi:spermidine synthase